MDYKSLLIVFLVVVVPLIVGRKIPIDSFEDSFEDTRNRKGVRPAEFAFLDLITQLLNTGYASSKIALNRIEKASEKRKQFGSQLEEFLTQLPGYNTKGVENPLGR